MALELDDDRRGERIALGIDPGTASTGYGIVRECGDTTTLVAYGVISTQAGIDMPRRLYSLYGDLLELIDRYHPDDTAVEALFFNKNVRTALSVGQARGVILLAAAQRGLAVSEYTPLQVKQTVAGYGRANKEQIQNILPALLNLDFVPEPDDAADAVAIALCHLHLSRLARVLNTCRED